MVIFCMFFDCFHGPEQKHDLVSKTLIVFAELVRVLATIATLWRWKANLKFEVRR